MVDSLNQLLSNTQPIPFVQLILGPLIESVHGTRDVIFIYFGGVVLGACTGLLLSPDKMTVGASGGDYALVFAYLANLIVNWDSMVSGKIWKWARLGRDLSISLLKTLTPTPYLNQFDSQ